jgi:hypothetical protein
MWGPLAEVARVFYLAALGLSLSLLLLVVNGAGGVLNRARRQDGPADWLECPR